MKNFKYNPHQHVKIWLSKNPNQFMNTENQIRLIGMREKNPNDTISLIYDSSLLSENARQELIAFCKENTIDPVDADAFVTKPLSDTEKQLFDYYKDEITNLQNGGNLGVASDILRWLSPSYRLGTYTDLDVPLDTGRFSETVDVNSPLLFNAGSLKLFGQQEMILTQNDCIAVVNEAAAQRQINCIQEGMLLKLKGYSSDFIEQTERMLGQGSFLNSIIMGFLKNRAEVFYIKSSSELMPPDKVLTSRNLRAYVNEIMTDKEKYLAFKTKSGETKEAIIIKLRQQLRNEQNIIRWLFFRQDYNETKAILAQDDDALLSYFMDKERTFYLKSIVICTTGPLALADSLYNRYVMTSDEINQLVTPLTFTRYKLHKAFLSTNVIPLHENPLNMLRFLGADVGELNDSSWLDVGTDLQLNRGQLLERKKSSYKAELPELLLKSKEEIKKHIQTIQAESESPGFFSKYFGQSNRAAKIKALGDILTCFSEDTFDTRAFKKMLEGIRSNKDKVYAALFFSQTQQIIENLDAICSKAILYSLTEDRKITITNSTSSNDRLQPVVSLVSEPYHTPGLTFFEPQTKEEASSSAISMGLTYGT